jgi:hypothetical protein
MYVRSPFRREKKKARIELELPDSINLLGFAFPEGTDFNDDSS